MKKYNLIRRYIPSCELQFERNEVSVNFEKDIANLAVGIGLITGSDSGIYDAKVTKKHTSSELEISLYDYNKKVIATRIFPIYSDIIEKYSILDALRDFFVILVGETPELAHHMNLLDEKDKELLNQSFNRNNEQLIEIPIFSIEFTRPQTEQESLNARNEFVSSLRETGVAYLAANARYNQRLAVPKPFAYIHFRQPVKIYKPDSNYIISQHFGLYVNDEESNYIGFGIFAFNEYLERGQLVFQRQALTESFLDLYDVFDALYMLLYSIKYEEGYDYKYKFEAVNPEELKNIPWEL